MITPGHGLSTETTTVATKKTPVSAKAHAHSSRRCSWTELLIILHPMPWGRTPVPVRGEAPAGEWGAGPRGS